MLLLGRLGAVLNRFPVLAKINFTVAVVFLLVVGSVTLYSGKREQDRVLELATNQTKDLTNDYFDGLNTMMLTGTMKQRDILRQKMLRRPNILEARVMRGEAVNKQYGPGTPDEAPVDKLDHAAMNGDEVFEVVTRPEGRAVTVITPFRATTDTNGVDCMVCHTVAPGTVNGAVRVTYSMANMEKGIKQDLWLGAGANLVLMTVGLLLASLLLRRWIIRPLGSLIDVVTKRTGGDLAARVPVSANDEIGHLGLAFNAMADTMDANDARERAAAQEVREKVNMLLVVVNKAAKGDLSGEMPFSGDDAIGGLAAGLGSMIGNLRSSIEEKRVAMDDLQKKVDGILGVVSRAAEGDMTGKIQVQGQDAIGQLAAGVQRMLDNLNALVTQVQKSGIQVTSSITEIAATAKQQEATVTEQAATINEIVATSTEISATTKELVNTMDEVSKVAENTAVSASDGQSALTKMESTMHQMVEASAAIAAKLEVLSDKAANINSVVTTITKVADQTNLLSLNAAIEAEKAGEYGLGFSVVATEIRRLADRTAVATWDIEQIVKEMQSAVTAGVMSVDKFSEQVRRSVGEVQQVGTQLTHIIDQVHALTPRFESVNEGMHFQSQGADQIKQAIVQLSESAMQTVDSLHQSKLAVERMHDAAHGLHSGVSRFKVSGKADAPDAG
jgi:methyl-accepting chemotaxis protein